MLLYTVTISVPSNGVYEANEAIILFWPVTWPVLCSHNRRCALSRAVKNNKLPHEGSAAVDNSTQSIYVKFYGKGIKRVIISQKGIAIN